MTFANNDLHDHSHMSVWACCFPKSVKEIWLCRTRLNEEIERPTYQARVKKVVQQFYWFGKPLRICPAEGRWPEDFDSSGRYDGPAIDEEIQEVDETDQWELTASLE